MTNPNPTIDKIRKLLALSSSSNEHEAELALSKAHALLAAHNLTLADIPEDTEEHSQQFRVNEFESEIKSKENWVRALAGVMTELHTVRCLRDHANYYSFVGTDTNGTAAAIMFEWLFDLINDWARTAAKTHPKDERKHARNSYKIGIVGTLGRRVKELHAAQSSTNLPAVITTLERNNQEFLDEKYSNLRQGRAVSLNIHHQAAYRQGREDGHKVNLQSNNVTSTAQPQGALT